MKLGRTYTMTVEVDDAEAIVINFPLTLTFDVQRNTLASANRGHFSILNLKPETRKRIFHDRYDTLTYRQLKLQAGYEDEAPLPTIFQGNIISAYSYRQGVDWVTEIEAFDGGFGIINSQVALSIPSGYTFDQTMRNILSSMQKVDLGAVGQFSLANSRGVTLMGNAWNLANQYANSLNATAFIDLEKANFLGKDEYLLAASGIPVIRATTGLLQTPRRFEGVLETAIVFEPRLEVGQLVALESLETIYNGQYSVIGIKHQGTISGAVGGTLTTTASLWLGTKKLSGAAEAA